MTEYASQEETIEVAEFDPDLEDLDEIEDDVEVSDVTNDDPYGEGFDGIQDPEAGDDS